MMLLVLNIHVNTRFDAHLFTCHPHRRHGLGKGYADRVIDGRKERVQFDKITARVSRLCYGLDPDHVDAAAITQKVISGVYQGVTTVELDNLVSRLEGTLELSLTPPGC